MMHLQVQPPKLYTEEELIEVGEWANETLHCELVAYITLPYFQLNMPLPEAKKQISIIAHNTGYIPLKYRHNDDYLEIVAYRPYRPVLK